MAESLFTLFCKHVDETIFPKENGGETVAFIVDQAFIDDFCKKYSTSEDLLLREVKLNLSRSFNLNHLHIKGILAIQLYAATKREDSGGITEKNYRDRLSQVLSWDIQDLQSWMAENQENYWARLYSWCDQNDFRITKCRPKTGAGRYVQYPVQQAARVFTQKDLKAIAYHFVQNKLQPNEDISEHDFWRILSRRRLPYYVHTNHGRRLVEVPDYLQDAYTQVYNFYLRWDGDYLDIDRNRSAKVSKEQHFLYLSEEGHLDIRDKDMKLEKSISWESLTSSISSYYTFKRSQWILFRRNDDYDGYWEETRYLEQRGGDGDDCFEEGMAVVFTSSDAIYRLSGSDPFSGRIPVYSDRKVRIYRFRYTHNLAYLYSEKKFFSLEGGLKVGRLQYMLGGAPFLTMSKDSRFWIDGEKPSASPSDGRLDLNFLPEGTHDIKFPGFKKIEFSIVRHEAAVPAIWDESYNKWQFSHKGKIWASAQGENGVVGLDYSSFRCKVKGDDDRKEVLTRWATLHLTGNSARNEKNIALRLLNEQ